MDHRALRQIATGFIIAVLIAIGIVFGATMFVHARHEAARADAAEHKLATTQASLKLTQSALGETGTALHTTQTKLTTTKQELTQRDAQNVNCRYLVRVNDHLLWGMTNYNSATGFLMDGRRTRAAASIGFARDHVKAIQVLVKRSGHTTISGLVNACTPPHLS